MESTNASAESLYCQKKSISLTEKVMPIRSAYNKQEDNGCFTGQTCKSDKSTISFSERVKLDHSAYGRQENNGRLKLMELTYHRSDGKNIVALNEINSMDAVFNEADENAISMNYSNKGKKAIRLFGQTLWDNVSTMNEVSAETSAAHYQGWLDAPCVCGITASSDFLINNQHVETTAAESQIDIVVPDPSRSISNHDVSVNQLLAQSSLQSRRDLAMSNAVPIQVVSPLTNKHDMFMNQLSAQWIAVKRQMDLAIPDAGWGFNNHDLLVNQVYAQSSLQIQGNSAVLTANPSATFLPLCASEKTHDSTLGTLNNSPLNVKSLLSRGTAESYLDSGAVEIRTTFGGNVANTNLLDKTNSNQHLLMKGPSTKSLDVQHLMDLTITNANPLSTFLAITAFTVCHADKSSLSGNNINSHHELIVQRLVDAPGKCHGLESVKHPADRTAISPAVFGIDKVRQRENSGCIFDDHDSLISHPSHQAVESENQSGLVMLNDEPILHIPPIAATGFPKTNSSVTYTINQLKVVCQLPTEDSEVQGQKDIGVPNVCPLSIPPTNSSTEKKRGRSRIKGVPFPKHAKDLLSTGIFDGIPVMYHHVSREDKPKRIQYAFIKGYGYLCGCCDCKHSKCMNAIEFQLHVGGKSCHPNSAIYFKSGKSVFEVVLELQKTAPERLSEAILSVTGCGLHEKNFAKWKASVLGRWRLGVKRQNGKQKGKKGKAKMNP